MKCISCNSFSFSVVCKECQENLLKVDTIYRQNIDGLDIFSFYQYSEIELLLKSKYSVVGSKVLKILAQNSLAYFPIPNSAYLIAIDDLVDERFFSHTAILVKTMKHKALFGVLRAKNRIQYAGKSKSFRAKNPKNFQYSGIKNIDVVLIDDVVTFGTTLSEAKKVLNSNSVNVLFALTLAKTID